MKNKFRLLDSGLTDPEYQTFFGVDAKRVADFSLTATACAALATIPAIGEQLSAVAGNLQIGLAGAVATAIVLQLYKLAVDGVTGMTASNKE